MSGELSGGILFVDTAATFGGAQIAMAYAAAALCVEHKVYICCSEINRRRIEEKLGLLGGVAEFVSSPLGGGSGFWGWLKFDYCLSGRRPFVVLNMSGIEFCLRPAVSMLARGTGFLSWLHNPEYFSFFYRNGPASRRLLAWIRDRFADALIFRLHRHIVTPSMATALTASRRASRSINQGVGVLYPTYWSEVQSKAQPESSGEIVRLAFVGRLEDSHKNCMEVVRVAAQLGKKGFRVDVTVIGDGPDDARFRDAVKAANLQQQVNMLGWMSDPWPALHRDAVLLVPSHFEGFPLVAIEAMAKGVRLVTSPLSCFKEGVPSDFVADSFGTESFVSAVLRAHSYSSDYVTARLGEAVRMFSAAEFKRRFLIAANDVQEKAELC